MNFNYKIKKELIERLKKLDDDEIIIIENIVDKVKIINEYIEELNKKKTA
ncbi:hypothetical protein [Terrisporobacter sp.]|nr:hypothetical protein [Terrisporobacter sp.]